MIIFFDFKNSLRRWALRANLFEKSRWRGWAAIAGGSRALVNLAAWQSRLGAEAQQKAASGSEANTCRQGKGAWGL